MSRQDSARAQCPSSSSVFILFHSIRARHPPNTIARLAASSSFSLLMPRLLAFLMWTVEHGTQLTV